MLDGDFNLLGAERTRIEVSSTIGCFAALVTHAWYFLEAGESSRITAPAGLSRVCVDVDMALPFPGEEYLCADRSTRQTTVNARPRNKTARA